jgi:hypothetical protein
MKTDVITLEYNTELTDAGWDSEYISKFDKFFRNECKRFSVEILENSNDKYLIRGEKFSLMKLFFDSAEQITDESKLQKFWDTFEKNSKKLKDYYLKIV